MANDDWRKQRAVLTLFGYVGTYNMGKGSRDETDWRDNVVPIRA